MKTFRRDCLNIFRIFSESQRSLNEYICYLYHLHQRRISHYKTDKIPVEINTKQ